MRIGEIAEKTGLSISNIRFYEKKGLIGPEREQESKYRNYTEADLERLKKTGTWLNRVVMACWCLLLMACPVIAILEDLIEKNGIHPAKLTFWILWILFLGYAFVSFRKAKKERGCL